MKTLIFDFSDVLLFSSKPLPKAKSLGEVYAELEERKLKDYFTLNTELLEFLTECSSQALLAIFSNSTTILRSEEISKVIQPLFSKIFHATELGWPKYKSDSYTKLFHELSISPQEVLYIDDKESNVEAARLAGAETHVFESTTQIIPKIKQFLGKTSSS